MQLSHGMIKRRVGVIYLPQRAEVEGANFLCLTHSLLSGRAEWVGMFAEMFLKPWTQGNGFTQTICPVSRDTEPVIKFMAL